MTPNTIDTLRGLGYTVGVAHGSVQVEEDALAAARDAADPNVVAEQASQVTTDTVQTLSTLGKLPETDAERLELVTKIAAAALEGLTLAVTEKVAFHERALAIAKEMPDVWRVEHWAVPPDNDGVPGPPMILSMLVACKPDGTGWDEDSQEQIDALADTDAFAERAFQALHMESVAMAIELQRLGVEVVRPKPGEDVWEAEGSTFTAADLPGFLEEVEARPAPPTTAEKVAAVLVTAPELGEKTRSALIAALEPDA